MTESTPRQTMIDAATASLRSFLETAGKVVAELAAGRMAQWLWATVPTVALVGFVNVDALGGIVKVLAKITLGAWLGYWIDRAAFRNARPHQPLEAAARIMEEESDREGQTIMLAVACAYMLRRAALIGACVLAAAIGV